MVPFLEECENQFTFLTFEFGKQKIILQKNIATYMLCIFEESHLLERETFFTSMH